MYTIYLIFKIIFLEPIDDDKWIVAELKKTYGQIEFMDSLKYLDP